MNSISKIALGVSVAGLASGFIGPAKLVIGGLVVAVVAAVGPWAWAKYIAPRIG